MTPLKPLFVAGAMLAVLGLMIWHSWVVKGPRQTVAFFLIAIIISWFCEFIGHNYAWFFGHYKYTDTLTPRIGGVPILIIITWSVDNLFLLHAGRLAGGLQGEQAGTLVVGPDPVGRCSSPLPPRPWYAPGT